MLELVFAWRESLKVYGKGEGQEFSSCGWARGKISIAKKCWREERG
jgi:hypothetical protein